MFRGCTLLLLCVGLSAAVPRPLVRSSSDIIIDGKENTIGLTTTDYFSGALESTLIKIVDKIVEALTPTPVDEVDYFAIIKGNVETVVGEYINLHNMEQLEAYKDDLAVLLQRYSKAPKESNSYPDKNTMANSLSTSIISNRFLIEAVEWPHSMMLHYADIASIHLLVLKDAADTYTSCCSKPSNWWRDLDTQLDHYITFGRNLSNTVVDWRNDMMTCSYQECVKSARSVCYDVWTVVDNVAELTDSCKALHGDDGCDDHCQAYQVSMNKEVSEFVHYYLGRVLKEWQELKLVSQDMVSKLDQ